MGLATAPMALDSETLVKVGATVSNAKEGETPVVLKLPASSSKAPAGTDTLALPTLPLTLLSSLLYFAAVLV